MTTPPLDALVRDRIGLDPASLGTAVIPTAVHHRMTVRRTATADDYAGLLSADPGEWAALVDELVVPETWFFRGGRPLFDHLAGWVAARAAKGPAVRVLSLPCSTGEEPYSLAIALRERSVPPGAYQIDGIDISPKHVARAAAARFAVYSFREAGADPRPLHFRPTDDGRWELGGEVRLSVRFRQGNAIDPTLLAGESPYDLIICRHLFIYLTAAARELVASNLDRLLAPDGVLCLSPAEAARLPQDRFVPCGPPAFCVFERAATPRPGTDSAALPVPYPRQAEPPRPYSPADHETTPPQSALVDTPLPAKPDPLAAARKLADAGRLDDAIAAYEQAARTQTSAGGFSLLGVIELARGRPDAAARAFRRALYLDPDHPEALSHMIVLCDHRGETAQADALRRRLVRVEREERA